MAKFKPRRPQRTNPHAFLRDAKEPLILKVMPADIRSAKKKDQMHCAAANALCRQEHYKQARVCKTKTYVQHRDGTWERYITPIGLYLEIMIFDRDGIMHGGEFKLMPPRGAQRLGHHLKPRGKLGQQGRVPNPIHTIEHVRADAPRGRNLERILMGDA
jgi:hypothetical protein